METIYLDHNATTPVRPEVVAVVAEALARYGANPASQHRPGQQARRALDEARAELAKLLGAELTGPAPDRLIFTSGGTEANNLAILGAVRAWPVGRRGNIVISAIEHPSVIEPAETLLEEGWRLDTLDVTGEGVICVDHLPRLLNQDTALVSIMLGNHETGVVQPVAEVARLCNAARIPLHTDAIQVAGKRTIDFRRLGVGALSVAAHKFQGPPGIGALVARHDFPLKPLLFGGAQQEAFRPGTETVALAVGMAAALRIDAAEQEAEGRRLLALRERFENGLRQGWPAVVINGAAADRLPNTSNVAFSGLDGQIVLVALDMAGVACSAGSACQSGSSELSPTLRAMNVPHEVLIGSLRFSLGATTTEAQVDEAVRRILGICGRI